MACLKTCGLVINTFGPQATDTRAFFMKGGRLYPKAAHHAHSGDKSPRKNTRSHCQSLTKDSILVEEVKAKLTPSSHGLPHQLQPDGDWNGW